MTTGCDVGHVVMNRDDVQSVRAERFEHRRHLGSNIATSPATIASASVPANAAHVLSPIRALIALRARAGRCPDGQW